MISLFGQEDFLSSDDSDLSASDVTVSSVQCVVITHAAHSEHKLKFILQRKDCDFIICDVCGSEFVGASFHCAMGCDFDLCADCAVRDDAVRVPKDEYLQAYDKESAEWKKIEQKDKSGYRSFSRKMDKKRKRKEKHLGLLGLENMNKSEPKKKRKLNVAAAKDKLV